MSPIFKLHQFELRHFEYGYNGGSFKYYYYFLFGAYHHFTIWLTAPQF